MVDEWMEDRFMFSLLHFGWIYRWIVETKNKCLLKENIKDKLMEEKLNE